MFFIVALDRDHSGPIIGGIGTLFGPVLGAFLLTGLSEGMQNCCTRSASTCPAPSRCSTASACLLVVMALPDGIWPWLARRLGLERANERASARSLTCRNASAGWSRSTMPASRSRAAIFAVIGPNGAGKTTLFNMIAGALRPDDGAIAFEGERIDGLRPDEICRARHRAHVPDRAAVSGADGRDNVMVGALLRPADVARGARARRMRCCAGSTCSTSARARRSLTLPDRKRLEVARALATEPQLLLLDEVMAGLRPTETDRMVAILRELNAQRADHPADRARDARRDGARDPRAGAASRRADRAREPGSGRARAGGDRVLSRRGGAVMLSRREHRCVLRRRAGARRRVARGRRRARSSRSSAPMARARPR